MASVVFDKFEVAKGNDVGKRYKTERKFIRLLEFCFALFIISSFFSYLPINDFFRRLFSVFENTFCVFLISNVIIFTVVLSFKNYSGGNSGPDIYDEFIANSAYVNNNRGRLTCFEPAVVKKLPEEIFQDKEIVGFEKKSYRRTKTENLEKKVVKPCGGGELQRSETDVCRIMGRKKVEEMSGEEFRMKIEEFIAMQKWNQKQEDLAVRLGKTEESSAMAITVG